MKKIFIILLVCLSFYLNAQKSSIKVEEVIAKDSLKTVLYTSIIEGYTKARVNWRIDHQSCPVFIDEEGFMFFIKLEDNCIAIVEIDLD
jgi:hypothetical protein